MTMPEIVIWLGTQQVDLFENKSEEYISAFCHNKAMRKIMCDYYNILLVIKKIISIENTSPEYKKALKDDEKEFAKGRLDTDGRIQLCKCLHVLSYHKTI